MDNFKKLNEAHNKIFKHRDIHKYIFVYTPPKVGSTTLITSLRLSLGNSYHVLHVHDEYMLEVLTGVSDIKITDLINFISSLGKVIYVIDVYRLPIERKMSEFFEQLGSLHFNNKNENIIYYNIDKIIKRFNDLFPYLSNGDFFFDKYNINVPDTFDFDKKFLLINKNNVVYIKLRLSESLYWSDILTNIFVKKIVIVKDYQTLNKGLGILYEKFKKHYCLPVNYVQYITECKYFKYYNTDNEQNMYISKWKETLSNEYFPFSENEFNIYLKISMENQIHNFIESNHYIDNGCQCKLCKRKRHNIYISCLNNKYNGEIINHNKCYDEYNYNILEKIKSKKVGIQKSKSVNTKLSMDIYNKHVFIPNSNMITLKF